jgi:3-oxoacyl-[acyl-carrier protein] reductase
MKIAVVTGAASGMGAACCVEFAARGYQVIGIDIQEPIASVISRELFLQFHIVNVSKVANIVSVVEEMSKSIDHVDVLVNAAGVFLFKAFEEMTEDDFDHTLNVNTKAPFFLSQMLLPLMTKGDYNNRSIVNITSTSATATLPGLATYTASKGGLTALTRTLVGALRKAVILVSY